MFASTRLTINHVAVSEAEHSAPPVQTTPPSPIAELSPDTMRLVLHKVARPLDLARFARASHAARAFAAECIGERMQHVHDLDAACVKAFGATSAWHAHFERTPTQAEIIRRGQQLFKIYAEPERRHAFLALMPHAAQLDLVTQRKLVTEAFAELSAASGRVRKLPGLLHLWSVLTPEEQPLVVQAVAQLFRTPDMLVAAHDMGHALGANDGGRHVLDSYPNLGHAIAALDPLNQAPILRAIAELATDAKNLDAHTRLGRKFLESLGPAEQGALQVKIGAYLAAPTSNAERARAVRFAGMGDGFFGRRLNSAQVRQIFAHIASLALPRKRAIAFSEAAPFFARYNDEVPLAARRLLESIICLDVPVPIERRTLAVADCPPAVRNHVEQAARLAAPHVDNVLNGHGLDDPHIKCAFDAVRKFLPLHERDLQLAAILMLRMRPAQAQRVADSRFFGMRNLESLCEAGIQAMVSLFVETAAEHDTIDALETLAPLVSRMSPETQIQWRRTLMRSSPALASKTAYAVRSVLPTLDLSTESARSEWRNLLVHAYGAAGD